MCKTGKFQLISVFSLPGLRSLKKAEKRNFSLSANTGQRQSWRLKRITTLHVPRLLTAPHTHLKRLTSKFVN